MMAVRVNRILPIRMVRPDRMCQKFKLRIIGPAGNPFLMLLVLPENFLKKNKIGIDFPNRIAHFMQDIRISRTEPFMHVIGQNFKAGRIQRWAIHTGMIKPGSFKAVEKREGLNPP